MFESWRLKLREAQEAFQRGRLDEAGRLLNDGRLREFLPAQRLLSAVAARLVERGQARAARGETSAGWRDLQAASHWGAHWQDVAAARRELSERHLNEVREYLAAGNHAAATARLDDLMRRETPSAATRRLAQAVSQATTADRLAREGKLKEACDLLAAAAATCPEVSALAERRHELAALVAPSHQWEQELHMALTAADWSGALAAAEALLDICSQHAAARDARYRAWAAVGTQLSETLPPVRLPLGREPKVTRTMAAQHAASESGHGSRFLLWIDAVGGFLVCQGARLVIGQPDAQGQVDVPILGDVSRRHAVIERHGEGHVLMPLRGVLVDGVPVTGPTPLVDGAVLTLGESVKLRFRRPHPLSNTARLEFVSHHRTQPSVDAIILMSDSCVMGPADDAHLVCPDWSDDVILFGTGERLTCRCRAGLEIDGQHYDEQGPAQRGARISSEGFSLSLEGL